MGDESMSWHGLLVQYAVYEYVPTCGQRSEWHMSVVTSWCLLPLVEEPPLYTILL